MYSYLPLGLRVLNNIVQIIREEMNTIGGQEMLMATLQDKTLWEKTDRWDDKKIDNWFKTTFKTGGETGLAITHEEPLTRIMTEHTASYRDLPKMIYQFQTKFRNELRAKSGILRGKEFLMKDLYSFARSQQEHETLYQAVRKAYTKIFERVGLGDRTYITFASGGIFSDFSEEFQILSAAGEDTIYIEEEKRVAVNKEVCTEEALKKLGLSRGSLVEKKAIEAGNIFTLGTRFSDSLKLGFVDEQGTAQKVFMGSYGLGPTRLMGALVEVFADDKGIVWGEGVAPFRVHVVELSGGNEDVRKEAEELYREIEATGVEVLHDDRNGSAGEKFADSDLLGIPLRVIVSPKTLAEGEFECVTRSSGKVERKSMSELLAALRS